MCVVFRTSLPLGVRVCQETDPIKRFDRHAEMSGDTRGEVLSIIGEMDSVEDESFDGMMVENYLFGLFDGYFYDQEIAQAIAEIKEYGMCDLATRMENLIEVIRTYNLTTCSIFNNL